MIAILYNFANPNEIKSSIIALIKIDVKLSKSQLIWVELKSMLNYPKANLSGLNYKHDKMQ